MIGPTNTVLMNPPSGGRSYRDEDRKQIRIIERD